jgi:8-oxo-dGTP pyrophosphatase MutT (NUDIX family)
MHAIAAGFLVDAGGRVLMGLRTGWKAIWPGRWDCIGGHIEPGETAAAALVREISEEVGVVPTAFQPIGRIAADDLDLRLYLVRAWTGGAPANRSDEHDAIGWFGLDALWRLTPIVPYGYADLLAPHLRQSKRLGDAPDLRDDASRPPSSLP